MTDAVESMAYVGNMPWHGHPNKVAAGLPVEEFMGLADILWEVERQPLYTGAAVADLLADSRPLLRKAASNLTSLTPDELAELKRIHRQLSSIRPKLAPGRYALVRKSDGRVLSDVGRQHLPRQNVEAFQIFKPFVEAGLMTMETAGSLQGGRDVWGLAKMPDTFALPGGDEIQNYLCVHQPHYHDKSTSIFLTPVEVVCWNTLQIALTGATEQAIIRIPHSRNIMATEVQEQITAALGLIRTKIKEFEQGARMLVRKKMKTEESKDFFIELLNFDVSKASILADGTPRMPKLFTMYMEALDTAPCIVRNRSTLWHTFGCVTYVHDHIANDNNRDTQLFRTFFGDGANIKRRAFDMALKLAA